MSYGYMSYQPAAEPRRLAIPLVGLGLICLVVALSDPTDPAAPAPIPIPKAVAYRTEQLQTPLVVHLAHGLDQTIILHPSTPSRIEGCPICRDQHVRAANVPAFSSE